MALNFWNCERWGISVKTNNLKKCLPLSFQTCLASLIENSIWGWRPFQKWFWWKDKSLWRMSKVRYTAVLCWIFFSFFCFCHCLVTTKQYLSWFTCLGDERFRHIATSYVTNIHLVLHAWGAPSHIHFNPFRYGLLDQRLGTGGAYKAPLIYGCFRA